MKKAVEHAKTTATDKLTRSDAFLRDCFDAGQSMFVSSAPVNTQDKSVLNALETHLIPNEPNT